MAYNSIQGTMRLTGLSSGLDTDTIIKNLMAIEQLKVDRVSKEQTKTEWLIDAKKEMSTLITNFRTANLSALTPQSNMNSEANLRLYNTVNLDQVSHVTLTGKSSGAEGKVTVDLVTALAESAVAQSTAQVTDGEILDRSVPLSDLATKIPFVFGGVGSDEISFSINNVAMTFKNTDSLQYIFNKINSSAANVTATYSELTNTIKIISNMTGSDSSVEIENLTGNAFGAGSVFGIETGTMQNGQDAELSINGTAVIRDSNSFTIDGVQYTLHSESNQAADFSIRQDVEGTIEKIKTFVSNYNNLIEALSGKLYEEVYGDYEPLTAEQRSGMSETDIENWEEKAKSGLLYRDRNLMKLVDDLRGIFYDAVADTGYRPSDIGLRTGAYQDRGKITLNETMLREKMEENPDIIVDIFTLTSDSENGVTKYNESGLASRMIDALADFSVVNSNKKNFQEIEDLSTRISEMYSEMNDKEDYYYRRFAAMESALAQLNSQSSWLSQQLY